TQVPPAAGVDERDAPAAETVDPCAIGGGVREVRVGGCGGIGRGNVVGAIKFGGQGGIIFNTLEENHVRRINASGGISVPLAEAVGAGDKRMGRGMDKDAHERLDWRMDAVVGGEDDRGSTALYAGDHKLTVDHRSG